MPGEDEPLHAYVTASNPESVKKAVDKVSCMICVLASKFALHRGWFTSTVHRFNSKVWASIHSRFKTCGQLTRCG